MNRIYQKSFSLRRLHRLIERGIFAVPELQREFVWNAVKACQLLDSVYRNYPIGSLLVWKTSRRNEGLLRKQFHILPPYDRSNKQVYFLVDGQQRLSVLWRFLRAEAAEVTNSDGKTIDFGSVYFDVRAGEDEPRFVYRTRVAGDLGRRLVAVVDILSPRWRQRIRNQRSRALAKIAECRKRILRYQAYVVFCESDEIQQVRETFVRINSLGMKISSADRAFARASSFDLRNDVRDALHRLKYGFNNIGRETVLQTIAFAMGGTDLGDRAIDSMITRLERSKEAQAEFEKSWPRIREAFAMAADHLVHRLDVHDADFLPSKQMMVVLTLYFFYNRNKRPPPLAQKTIRRWFWATAVGARYTGRGWRPNVLADVEFMRRLARKPGAHTKIKVSISPFVLRQTEYRRPGPLSNAFFILLRRLKPRYLEDATPIPAGEISSRKNRSDKHHIYPRGLLLRAGIGADRFNSILNICYLVARENQSIGKHAPRFYLDDIPRSMAVRRRAMKSHLIPGEPGSGIWNRGVKRGFTEFLAQRTNLLMKEFEREAGMRLFDRHWS